MANLDGPAAWVALKSEHPHVAVCRDCSWRGSHVDTLLRSQREQGERHATEHRGHVVLLAELTVNVCVAPDMVFALNQPHRGSRSAPQDW